MRQALYLPFLLVLTLSARAQVLSPDESASAVKFKIKNLGVNVGGSIKGLTGKIIFNPASPQAGSIETTVAVSTLNTGIEMRDDHLKKEDYFDQARFPQIRFVSDRIAASNRKDTYIVYGKLTIKGITKDVSFPFTALPEGGGYRLKGEFTLNRRDFKVGGSSITLADKVIVTLDVLAR